MLSLISQSVREIDASVPTEGMSKVALEITNDFPKYMLNMPELDFKLFVYVALTCPVLAYNHVQPSDVAAKFKVSRDEIMGAFHRLNRLRIETRRVMVVALANGPQVSNMFQIVLPKDSDIDSLKAKNAKEIS